MKDSGVDYADIQSLVRFGHGQMPEACFFLLRVKGRVAARSWLAAAPVLSAVERDPRPTTALQVAFTREGLEALGVPAPVIQDFSAEFISGMAGDACRSRRLGDVGVGSPATWQWGGPGNVPHLVVMLYAESGGLESLRSSVQDDAWHAAFEPIESLHTSNLDGTEPFGFADGISQPALDWDGARDHGGGDQLRYGNLLALGEFLLGYRNEYGKYTDRPLVDDPTRLLPPAEDVPGKRDVGRNGTYLVLRQLRQDVRGWWQFLDRQADGDPRRRQELAEAMVGRRMSGEPLIPVAREGIPGVGPGADDIARNQFTYETDGAGGRCPFGAHVRRANPRSADLPYGTRGLLGRLLRTFGFGGNGFCDDLIASARFHRLLRRGREYGPGLPVERALEPAPADDPERGLHFIGLNANLSRQFEFVQGAWVMSTKFGGLTEESDPLLGNREPVPGCPVTNTFSRPRPGGARRRIEGVPRFITVRGGAYFFLPGLRALRYLASVGT
jgi:deferrochelatase/peroxidase EfeB